MFSLSKTKGTRVGPLVAVSLYRGYALSRGRESVGSLSNLVDGTRVVLPAFRDGFPRSLPNARMRPRETRLMRGVRHGVNRQSGPRAATPARVRLAPAIPIASLPLPYPGEGRTPPTTRLQRVEKREITICRSREPVERMWDNVTDEAEVFAIAKSIRRDLTGLQAKITELLNELGRLNISVEKSAFVCPKCGADRKGARSLADHLANVHGEEPVADAQ